MKEEKNGRERMSELGNTPTDLHMVHSIHCYITNAYYAKTKTNKSNDMKLSKV
jgi:hypothetical protein